jgi:hypothetical protein
MQSCLVLLLALLANQLVKEKAGNTDDTNDDAIRATVATSAKDFAARCEFIAEGTGKAKLVLHPEPILRWSNPTAGKVFGEVFVWTNNGRPAVVGCWYQWFSPYQSRTFETCSLSETGMTGRIKDNRFWKTEKPGLSLKPLKEVDAPAKIPAARLVQMRRIAGDFVANLADTRGNHSGVKRQLRLLTQPVFRYSAAKPDATYLDGALFAFVEGTDPEAFLILEATKTPTGTDWQFGLVRMNSDALNITFRDTTVWTVPLIENSLSLSKEPYALFVSDHIDEL